MSDPLTPGESPLERLIALAQEVYDSHRSKDGSDSDLTFDAKTRQWGPDVPCAWCEDYAKLKPQIERLRAALASTPQKIGEAMGLSENLLVDGAASTPPPTTEPLDLVERIEQIGRDVSVAIGEWADLAASLKSQNDQLRAALASTPPPTTYPFICVTCERWLSDVAELRQHQGWTHQILETAFLHGAQPTPPPTTEPQDRGAESGGRQDDNGNTVYVYDGQRRTSDATALDRLEPCPFCGGEPYATRTVNGTQMFKVGCAACGVELKAAWYRDEDKPTKDIVSLWNRRPRRRSNR